MPRRDISEVDMWSMDQIRNDYTEMLNRMMNDGGLPDGIFVPTDQQCSVLHTILRERGAVPGKDLITISCNNDSQWLATMHPRPATIDLCTAEQGRLCFKRLEERIAKPEEDPIVTMVTPKIVE